MGLLKPRPALAFGHMEVRVDTDAPDVAEQVTYLYNFREGRSTSSFGTW
jgi:DNA mismatch repair protein MSH5